MKVRDRFDKNRIGDLVCDGAFEYVQNFAVEINGKRVAEYDSLDGVAEDWEDYKPAEPLIEDEKIRKAVRAWAELHKLENVFYFEYSIHEELSYLKSNDTGVVIDIVALPELKDGKIYTIAELCGEEEE